MSLYLNNMLLSYHKIKDIAADVNYLKALPKIPEYWANYKVLPSKPLHNKEIKIFE